MNYSMMNDYLFVWIIFLIFISPQCTESKRKVSVIKNRIQIFSLYIIVDFHFYRQYQYNIRLIERAIQSIFILVNKAYLPLNIQFRIVHVEIWTGNENDYVNEQEIIDELKQYKQRSITIYHDCLHALIGSRNGFKSHGYGEFLTMCSRSSCVGYTLSYVNHSIKDTAFVISHELAHNFGLNHDISECKCTNCIMATGIEISRRSLTWSRCSVSKFQSLLKYGYPSCRPNVTSLNPINLMEINYYRARRKTKLRMSSINIAICGNGIIEIGEQCDCGKSINCERCCNPVSCKLASGAQCSSGPCCNRTSCKIMSSSFVCRPSPEFCDLPEFCSGADENCEPDFHKLDGTECRTTYDEKAYCIRGKCRNHLTQCRWLWGETANNSDISCYQENIKNDKFKNCGTIANELNNYYGQSFMTIPTKECTDSNLLCGRLWCTHGNEKLMQLGLSKTSSFISSSHHFCESSRFELDWRNGDIGLVPDGAPCGNNKLCFANECVNVSTIFDYLCLCSGKGICDSRRKCHCFPDYRGPNCGEKIVNPISTKSLPGSNSDLCNVSKRNSNISTLHKLATESIELNVSKYFYKIQFLKFGLILISGLLFVGLIVVLLNKPKLNMWKGIYVRNLKNYNSILINKISYKPSFFQTSTNTRKRTGILNLNRGQINTETKMLHNDETTI